ncbi:hypothetical protein Q0590_31430 [Rhodocytophaga aerolata]|uniref:SGNH/GDSL hydrolase family protein n=1 Tax=Rhodocytophaga aerolata TaxID=455078 RepID=A0ABT8RFE7_9BACT|nr:hypothetical protein [Rhodocytophaga aerolata]MDO1450828.1 hypothetical protein [Rhodocytophaga aerolata]
MQTPTYTRAALGTLLLVAAFIAGWETYWRSEGFPVSYNDDGPLWANKRKEIYHSTASAPVIIGASRIKYDVDLATWEKICGQKPVQLALVGTSPRPVLKDLADDVNFKGFVLVDVSEGSFFTPTGSPYEARARERIAFYPKWSLAQQGSFQVNRVLESSFVFLDDRFSLSALLPALPLPKRESIKPSPPAFPRAWTYVNFDRQTFMSQQVIRDTTLLNQVKKVWMWSMSVQKGHGGDTLQTMLDEVKLCIDKIKARGGKVLFVRPPSNGPYREHEKKVFPRERYWDRLLAYTQTAGIHFEDYPDLAHYQCPEWSHLTPEDAIPFTASLIRIMRQKSGWWSSTGLSTPSSFTSTSSTNRF